VIEPDFLEISDTRTLSDGGRVLHGIEFNAAGKRVAYHFLTEHPGNTTFLAVRQKVRVPADEVAHIYRVDRPGQNRGIPVLAPIMLRLKDLDEYEDAQLVRQKIAACFSVFIPDMEPGNTSLTGEGEGNDLDGEKVEPGLIEILPPGKDIKFASPPTVEGYKEYMSVNLHSIAAGLGVSYEALTGDLEEVNFSSARMGWLEMQRVIDSWRSNVIIPLFLDFVAQKFLQTAFLTGERVTGARAAWTPPRREMIDPTKEVPATINAIRGGLLTLSEAIRQHGHDPREHLQEWADDAKLLDDLDLVFDSDPRKVNKTGLKQVEDGDSKPDGE
jgi:lambda family phage portal protein